MASSGNRPTTVGRTQDLRVLAVEDHEISRRLLESMLASFGAECTFAATAGEALELADSQIFDIVLLDCSLPDMSGQDLAQRLCHCAGTRRAGILAVTGQPRPSLLPPAFAGWLEKPYSVRDLYTAVLAGTHRRVTAHG